MVFFSLIFLLLSYLKYETKLVSALKRYSNRQDNISSNDSNDTDASVLDSARDALQSSQVSVQSETSGKKKKPAVVT